MKIYKYIALFCLTLTMFNCEEYDPTVAPAPLSYGFTYHFDNVKVDEQDPVYQIEVHSTQKSDVDRVVNIVYNEEESTDVSGDLTFENTILIPAGSYVGYSEVVFDFDNIPLGEPRKLVLDMVLPNDGSVVNSTSNSTEINYSQLCTENTVTLDLVFDDWPEETSWELYNSDLMVIYSGGAGGAYEGLTDKTIEFCLEDGDYTFVIYDSYGDGICCASGNGSYTISNAAGEILATGGEFTSYDFVEFTL